MGATCVIVSLVGCGGGGGGGGNDGGANNGQPSPGGTPPTGTLASVDIALTTPPILETLPLGYINTVTVEGTWTGRNLGNGAVYVKVTDDAGATTYKMPAPQAAPGGTFQILLEVPASHSVVERSGTLSFTACGDANCATPYTGVAGKLDYRVLFSDIGEWETMGRDGTHRSYVPITIDPTRIEEAWEWTFPKDAAARQAMLTRPATIVGTVFVTGFNLTNDRSQYGHTLFALDEATGKVKWSFPVEGHALAPGAARGRVVQPALDSSAMLTVLDAALGKKRFTHGQSTANASTLVPSFYDRKAFFMGGDTGNEIRSIDLHTGALDWSRPRIGMQTTTLAVDGAHVYYHTGSELEILDRGFGSRYALITDPASDGAFVPGPTAPMLGSQGNVIVRSWHGATHTAKLTSFDIASRQWAWSTVDSYTTPLAVGKDMVYAYREAISMPLVHAIDESTGNVMWNWIPPAPSQTNVAGNLVATDNLLFASTSGAYSAWTWAIDLSTRQVVWQYPASGYVVISANRMMYLLADKPNLGTPERIVAFRLR